MLLLVEEGWCFPCCFLEGVWEEAEGAGEGGEEHLRFGLGRDRRDCKAVLVVSITLWFIIIIILFTIK